MAEPASQTQDTSAEDLAAQIESLLGGEEKTAPEEPPAPESEPVDSADALTQEDLGAAVEQMLEDAIAKVDEIREEAASARPPRAGAANRDGAGPASADDELTRLAEQISAGENPENGARAQGEERHLSPEAAKEPPATTFSAPVEESKGTPSAGPAGGHERAHAPPGATDADHRAPKPSAVMLHKAPQPGGGSDAPAIRKPRGSASAAMSGLLKLATRPLAKAIAMVVTVLALPLAGRKPIVKDSAGWIAVVTLFMGVCMWAAVLLRDPKPFIPETPPVQLHETAGAGEKAGAKGASHGEAKAGGGKKEAGHGEAKGEAKKAQGSGEKKEGHAGAAGGTPAKRAPLIQPGLKKAAPKKAEGGGH